jgi:hypothetical protein
MVREKLDEFDRSKLIKRLFIVLEKQVSQLENAMVESGDKEVALLGVITRNLDKLIDLDQKERATKPNKKRSKELGELKKKLSDRIEQLRGV